MFRGKHSGINKPTDSNRFFAFVSVCKYDIHYREVICMRSTNKPFSITESRNRIRAILDAENYNEEVENIPLEDNVGLKSGYYVNAMIISVDLRDSTGLIKRFQKRVVARILRAYISELTAIMNSPKSCRYLSIQGDGMFGVYNCRNKEEIIEAYLIAPAINSVIKLLNKEFERKGYSYEMKVGIGLDMTKILMIKGGFRGESINEILWIGEAINTATHIAKTMNKEISNPIGMTESIYAVLTKHDQSLYRLQYSLKLLRNIYIGSVVLTKYDDFTGSY